MGFSILEEFDWNEEEIVRFNFFRYLFLERNLWYLDICIKIMIIVMYGW